MKRPLRSTLCLAAWVLLATAVAVPRAAGQDQARPNPAVLALRESNPTTPSELVRAIRITAQLRAYEDASSYFQRLLDLELDEPALIDLHEEHGSATFLGLVQDPNLPAEGRQFAMSVIEAAGRYTRDPQRLEALIGNLSDPHQEVRTAALAGLLRAQEAAIAPLVASLADPESPVEPEYIQATLIRMGEPAVEPLVAVLQSPDEDLKARAITVLGRLDSRDPLAYLVRPLLDPQSGEKVRQAAAQAFVNLTGAVPSADEAQRYLADRAGRYYEGRVTPPVGADGLAHLWRWREGAIGDVSMPLDVATGLIASDLATDLYALWPENVAYRRMFLVGLLESEKRLAGLDAPLPRGENTAHAQAAAEGVEALEDLLRHALVINRVAAATAVCEVLGDTGDLGLLDSRGGSESILVQMLRHPNRRLRFFAAQAVLKLDPTEPFAGSNDLMQTLGYFARTSGQRRALVGHPHDEYAHTLVGMLNDLGFHAEPTSTGRELFLRAVDSPDWEFFLISGSIDHPSVGELVQMLRKDPRTAAIPVGLLPRSDDLDRLRDLAALYPPAAAYPMPLDEQAMIGDVQQLLALSGEHYLPASERVAQANAALSWLAQLASDPERYGFYDVLSQEEAALTALQAWETSAAAARLLGLMATPAAQQALVEVASQNARPLAQRRAAAEALAAAVEKRGLLLTTEQILHQYDRYNASETLDPDTQAVLGSLLDVIEAPTD